MSDRRAGFTIVEVLIAVIILAIGILALTSSAATITRMMTNGAFRTKSSAIAQARVEQLRSLANTTSPKCTDPGFTGGSRAVAGYTGFSEKWGVTINDKSATVVEIVVYRAGPTQYQDTTIAEIYCP